MTHILRSLIRESLLLEEVYGAQATVYHGTKADPQELISAILRDELRPGEGAGSMYGKGLYTVYNLTGTQTEMGDYGAHVIKLKVNLYGYIIFDPDVALKVYKAPLSIVEQSQELGLDEEIIEKLRKLKVAKSNYTSDKAEVASRFLKGRVKGLIFTGRNDGRVAVVYDPMTAVPMAWKRVARTTGGVRKLVNEPWTPVNRESIKPALRRSASGDWEKEKYEPIQVVKKLEMKPLNQRVFEGSLDLENTSVTSLPAGLKVKGYLNLGDTPIKSLPAGLQVDRELYLARSGITSLPADLQVGGSINLSNTPIKSLPSGLKVVGNLDLRGSSIVSLPTDLQVGGNLYISDTSVTSLPAGLQVSSNLDLSETSITSLPAGLKVGGDLNLSGSSITALPSGLKVEGNLDLRSTSIASLPADIYVGGSLIIYDTPITSLPQGFKAGIAVYGLRPK